MNTPERVAFYNLENTIANFVIRNTLNDAAELGLIDHDINKRGLASIEEERRRFLGMVAGKNLIDLEPLLDRTADLVPERLAPWSYLTIGAQAVGGYTIGLYSATLPYEIVEAYANGIEELIMGADVKFIHGRPVLKDERNRYLGILGLAPKHTYLNSIAEQGYRIDFNADSFRGALGALNMARNKLLVNPAPDIPEDELVKYHRLIWSSRHPYITKVITPFNQQTKTFNLAMRYEQQEFMSYFLHSSIRD